MISMVTFYKNNSFLSKVIFFAFSVLSAFVLFYSFTFSPEIKLLVSAFLCVTLLSIVEIKYFFYYVVIFSCFLFFTSNELAMSPIDSAKFYSEAFQGGYYDAGFVSTIVAVGATYSFLSSFLHDQNPQNLVVINFLLHCLSVVFLTRTLESDFEVRYNQKRLIFSFFLFLSPILIVQLPLLIKDYFAVFFSTLSFYCFFNYLNHQRFFIFGVIFLLCSMVFRVYSPIYIVMFLMVAGVGRKFYFLFIMLLISLLFITFGISSLYYFSYSFLAIFLIPNFLSFDNYIAQPLVTLESLFVSMMFVFRVVYLFVNHRHEEVKDVFCILILIAITYAFTSLYRINYSDYDSGSFLSDNFFRKKIPIVYVVWYMLLFSRSKFFIKTKINSYSLGR